MSLKRTVLATPSTVTEVLNALTTGEETIPRQQCAGAVGLTSQLMRFTYFTARKTESISQIRVMSSATAAAATPTLVRFGIYSVAANGDLTLVANTASDTAVFAAANTAYTKSLAASFTKTAGQRYAWAPLVVSGTTMPSLPNANFNGPGTEMRTSVPVLATSLSAQSDLPSSVTFASLGNSTQMIYAVLLP